MTFSSWCDAISQLARKETRSGLFSRAAMAAAAFASLRHTELARFNEFIGPNVLVPALRKALKKDAVPEARFEAASSRRSSEAPNAR